jgi:hypothetical protein
LQIAAIKNAKEGKKGGRQEEDQLQVIILMVPAFLASCFPYGDWQGT